MRRKLMSFVVAAIAAFVPALALAGNQQVAEQIANALRQSGQMSDYKIGVKFQDGTAWLVGRVSSEEQMSTAIRLTFEAASVNCIHNEMTIAESQAVEPTASESPEVAPPLSDRNPLRDAAPAAETAQHGYADRVPSSYAQTPARTVADEEPEQMPANQPAKPVANGSRGGVRMARVQSDARVPVASQGAPLPMYTAANSRPGVAPARYDQPCMPNYAWPSYAAYPNYAAVTYPKQYSPTAWPYIGPFYPYPQVPLGWRKVTLEWDSGWWFLDFKDQPASCWRR